MAGPYIPSKDPDLRAFAVNYRDVATANPGTYGLSGADVTAITSSVNSFVAALDAYTVDTRSVVLVAAKNTAKLAMVNLLRTYSSQIRLNPGISNADKLALGLNLPNNSPSPIPPPTTVPLLAVIAATPGQHTLRYADQATPDKRSKPFGAVALQLFVAVGIAAVTDPADAEFYGQFTKQPVPVLFGPSNAGKVATYFGRWVTRSGPLGVAQVGPFSSAVSFVIPGN